MIIAQLRIEKPMFPPPGTLTTVGSKSAPMLREREKAQPFLFK